jgi:serine/tyrosine/threonine adenylyltransferase
VRLSHSHIRIGSFQRLAALGLEDEMARLIDHCVAHYYPEADDANTASKAAKLLEFMTGDSAAMVASWMAAGFVHGVMNTDNFNLTGETFDFGPYRFLPHSDPNFTAAYFDHAGLYRFGAQPGRGFWNMQQLASSLTLVTGEDTEPLVAALKAYEPAYQDALVAQVHARLGLAPLDDGSDLGFVAELFSWMSDSGADWQGVFHDWFCGEASATRASAGPRAALYAAADFKPIRNHLAARQAVTHERLETASLQATEPENLLYDEIEALWAHIAEHDDWAPFDAKLDRIEAFRRDLALSPPGAPR